MQRASTQVTAAQQNLDVAKSTLTEIKQKVSLSMVLEGSLCPKK